MVQSIKPSLFGTAHSPFLACNVTPKLRKKPVLSDSETFYNTLNSKSYEINSLIENKHFTAKLIRDQVDSNIAFPISQGLMPLLKAVAASLIAAVAKKGVEKLNSIDKKGVDKKPPFNGAELGTDPSRCPAPGFEWKGKGPPGSAKGNWVRGEEKLNPDLDHPDPFGPHWDYVGPDSPKPGVRLNPDGTWEYKGK